MGRQRTVNDHGFWHNPLLQRCKTDEKTALLYLLTSPVSNIIGAYAVIPRIAAAEIGWSEDQWLQVVERLRVEDLVWFDPTRMFVWVRSWWSHNIVSQTMGPKLRARTIQNIRQLPDPWLAPFLTDYKTRLPIELRPLLDASLAGEAPPEESSARHGYPIDVVSNLSRDNSNANTKPINKITTTLVVRTPVPVDKSGIPQESQAQVEAAIAMAQRNGVAKADTQTIFAAVARQFQSKSPPRNAGAYAFAVAKDLTPVEQEAPIPAQPSSAALEDWGGRCFCWPANNPIHFIQIEQNGQHYAQISLGRDSSEQKYETLSGSKPLADLRAGQLREINPNIFSDLAKGARS